MSAPRALSGMAFATLLLIALMMGANHVAARLAFNHGANVATAAVVRSLTTAAVVAIILLASRVPWAIRREHRLPMLGIGLLIGMQGLCLYSSVARLPVALALLAFNTYPLWTALWDALLYKRKPERAMLLAMPVILVGLALALDVLGAASGLGAQGQWRVIGVGVAFAIAAAAVFGLALVLTQHETEGVDGRVRTVSNLALAGMLALAASRLQGGLQFPVDAPGWAGLAALSFLYGTAFTILFTVLPRLGVAGNSAIMNVEPVFALILAWAVLGQAIAPIQLLGAVVVVATVMVLGLRRR